MARILDNILPAPGKRLLKLRRDYQWLQSEMKELPERLQQSQRRQLSAYGSKLNRKIVKNAFIACDKVAYADFVMAQKLQAFDIRQYKKYRAVNHRCVKTIFRSAEKGNSWQAALTRQAREVEGLQIARAAYVKKLEGEKQRFLASHSHTDESAYLLQKKELNQKLECYRQDLERSYAKRLTFRSEKLKKKLDSCKHRIETLEAKIGNAAELPEDVLLRVEGLKMYFGGLKAVDDLTFDVKKGEIFGLIGPNGAGKTTVFNCITRFYDATDGNMYFVNRDGTTIDLRKFAVHDVILQGISRTFQNVELVKEVSVLDNLLIASTREYRTGILAHALGLPMLYKEERMLREKALRVLKFMGLENYAGWLAFGLPYGILKKVEIARALMSDTKLIIMDEPAAGLNDTETAELTHLIRRIRDEFQVTILLVEHDMGLVMNVCDTICAISFGKMLAIGNCEQIQQDPAVQEAYLGVEEDA